MARDTPAPDAPRSGSAEAFYRHVLELLAAAGVPAMVGGAYALAIEAGIERPTKDLDLFLRRADHDRAAAVLAAAGYRTELAHPHWLGKAHDGPYDVDLIFSSGNGLSVVDDAWFEHAREAEVLGVRMPIVPVEETLWSKMFVMERERYDGADVAHLLRACAHRLDWPRLLARLGPHWRVLLAHVVLFGFVYPAERDRVPARVVHALLERMREETDAPPPAGALCRGTLLSRAQYLDDVERHGYQDGRRAPAGPLSDAEIAAWTDAIPERRDSGTGPGADPHPGAQPGTQPGTQPDPEPDPHPNPRRDPHPDPRPGPRPAPKPGPTPDPKPGPKPGPKPDPNPGPHPDPHPGPRADPDAAGP